MQIIKLSQSEDRIAWLEARRGVVTGSKAKKVKPLSRGVDRTPAGFWELLSDKVSIAKDAEPDMARGHRLEPESVDLVAEKYSLGEVDSDCGMWVSDENAAIAVSPDGSEKSDTPTFAIETKSLSSPLHIKYIVKDRRAKKLEGYRPFDNVPDDFKEQVLQYFVVNENLKTMYFALYDDRMAFDHLMHYVIVIDRSDVKEEIMAQMIIQDNVIKQVNETLTEIINE